MRLMFVRPALVVAVVPVPGTAFDEDEEIRDEGVERQLRMLGSEVVRLAAHFSEAEEPDHRTECARARDRVASLA